MLSTIKHYCIILMTVFAVSTASAQLETSKWKALVSLGINSPSQEGLVAPFEANTINFPTINLGLQRMFTPQLGAKLDFGYNRFANADDTPEFKTNYTRINLQFVYDGTRFFSFLPIDTGVVFHAGPGYSMIKPLGDYGNNKTSFLNGMAGLEFHYGLSRSVSTFFDASYIYGFGKDFDPIREGFGSFNGNMLTVTVGVSVSLSGCYTCN